MWAVAGCLYFVLTGEFPRNLVGKDPIFVVLQTDAVPILDRTSAIPKPLAQVIDRALIDNPEIYYKTAAEFKQAL